MEIGIVDDVQLFVKSLSLLINTFDSCEVTLETTSGEDLLQKLSLMKSLPDILLIDVSMPIMDGIKTATCVSEKYPSIKLAALSTNHDDFSIIGMIRANCCSYLLKDMHPTELEHALREIYRNGYYNADAYNRDSRRLMRQASMKDEDEFTEREKKFLELACTDLTYKAIASKMHLAERTIDGYREALFEKLNVQSRVGMALEAVRRKLVSV